MAKDYMQDITPPNAGEDGAPSPLDATEGTSPRSATASKKKNAPEEREPESSSRGIRNIQVSATRQKLQGGSSGNHRPPPPRAKRNFSRYALWGGVALALVVLILIGLVALRPTSVEVIPRSHTILFDDTMIFTAQSADSGATTTLPFTLENITIEDSEIVPAEGVEQVEEKASGTITVYNEYSASSVKLIKNTRFETPGGLVFRTPSEVIVPGKKGSTPGEVSITVFADKVGEEYNIEPVDTFRLPGLASTPDMYKTVYARSGNAMTGGFSGERPAAEPAALEAAQAQIRSRLEEKIRAAANERTTEETFAFADLAKVTFESLTPAPEEGGVRMRERARIELPIFAADVFAYRVGENVSAAADIGAVTLKPLEGFAAHLSETSGSLSDSPISFALTGKARLVWNVDTEEFTSALVGRDEIAFEAIAETFPGIEEARARIQPFWKRTFPADASKIKIEIQEPLP